jgi:hypothetical protein
MLLILATLYMHVYSYQACVQIDDVAFLLKVD